MGHTILDIDKSEGEVEKKRKKGGSKDVGIEAGDDEEGMMDVDRRGGAGEEKEMWTVDRGRKRREDEVGGQGTADSGKQGSTQRKKGKRLFQGE